MFLKNKEQKKKTFIQILLIISGWFSVGMGFIGIFIPMLPTTPFLLLAAVCFAKSSPRFHNWLLTNKLFGRYISDYKERRGMKLSSKILSISTLNLTILLSVIYATDILLLRILLIAIAIAVTIHLLKIKTLK